ncbi:MAG: thymidine kinase [Melioribacteraceae bacterium]|nr:thymidine kinase [Melioribacteraceae bacterium]
MINYSPHFTPKDTGWIEVITGCMFSGKTEELIRRLRRAQIAKQNVIIFKPAIDKRYSSTSIVSHSELSLPSVMIEKPEEIIHLSEDAYVIGIDEAQFFDNTLIDVVEELANSGKRVVIAGLDQDYRGIPFEPIPQLLARAEFITKTLAICVACGNPADKTQRKTATQERVLVGASDSYEARCRKCHYIP